MGCAVNLNRLRTKLALTPEADEVGGQDGFHRFWHDAEIVDGANAFLAGDADDIVGLQ